MGIIFITMDKLMMDKSSLPITIGLVLLRYLKGYKHNKSTKIRANGDTSGSVAKKASWYVPESPVPLLIRLQRLRRKAFTHSFSRSESKLMHQSYFQEEMDYDWNRMSEVLPEEVLNREQPDILGSNCCQLGCIKLSHLECSCICWTNIWLKLCC